MNKQVIKNKPILIIEDDPIDMMTLKQAFKANNIENQLVIVNNGDKALKYLKDPKKKKPYLIFLDWNVQIINGVEFLKIAKQDNTLKMIPIVVLTTSDEEKDQANCYDLGADLNICKTIDLKELTEIIRIISFPSIVD